MDLEKLKNQIEEDVLEFMLQPKFKKDIKKARECFYEKRKYVNKGQKIYIDFNLWLIYDYRLDNGMTFLESYFEMNKKYLQKEKKELIIKKIDSFLGLYELKEIHNNQALFEELFTKDKIYTDTFQAKKLEIGDFILSRCIDFEGSNVLIDIRAYIPNLFKNVIEKGMIYKYEEYKNKHPYGEWKQFLKQNSLLLLSHVEIIINLIEKNNEDDAKYDVWQSVYFIRDQKQVREIFIKNPKIQLDFEENGAFYFKYYKQNALLAEIVLKNKFLELECVSEQDREQAKNSIEQLLGDLVSHYKDEVIGLYDII